MLLTADGGVTIVGGVVVVLLAFVGFVEEVTPLLATRDHAIDGAPVGESTHVAVIDKEVGLQLAREVGVVVGGFLRIIAIGGVELDTALTTPLEGLVEELALATGPEDNTMAIGDEHLQRIDGEGTLSTDLRVFVLDDGTVEVYGDDHKLKMEDGRWMRDDVRGKREEGRWKRVTS
jgi:hypothetical protein